MNLSRLRLFWWCGWRVRETVVAYTQYQQLLCDLVFRRPLCVLSQGLDVNPSCNLNPFAIPNINTTFRRRHKCLVW